MYKSRKENSLSTHYCLMGIIDHKTSERFNKYKLKTCSVDLYTKICDVVSSIHEIELKGENK